MGSENKIFKINGFGFVEVIAQSALQHSAFSLRMILTLPCSNGKYGNAYGQVDPILGEVLWRDS